MVPERSFENLLTMTYKLCMLSELAPMSVERTIEAQSDQEAIAEAETVSDAVPVLVCMDLYDENNKLVKHW